MQSRSPKIDSISETVLVLYLALNSSAMINYPTRCNERRKWATPSGCQCLR